MAGSAVATLAIDLDALAHNHAVLKREAAGAELAPVVKADGYGLGAGPIARRLWREGARSFFVARLSEGEALRAALGPDRPAAIFVLDGFTPDAGPGLEASALTPVLASLPQVAAARAWAMLRGRPTSVALQVDTGMNRIGLEPGDACALRAGSGGLEGLDLRLVMSHLGSAAAPEDPRNRAQLAAFSRVRRAFDGTPASLAASAGVFLGADYRFDMVRPGISLFGGGPQERPDARLRAVATLKARILDVRELSAGARVGYGDSTTVRRPTRVAVVAAGYADGVIRAARGGGTAWFAGARRRLISVTMDLMVVDIGDAPAAPGDEIELLGENALLDDLAEAGGTVAHELLVRMSRRATRVHLGEA